MQCPARVLLQNSLKKLGCFQHPLPMALTPKGAHPQQRQQPPSATTSSAVRDDCCVRVALRARPLIPRERLEGAQVGESLPCGHDSTMHPTAAAAVLKWKPPACLTTPCPPSPLALAHAPAPYSLTRMLLLLVHPTPTYSPLPQTCVTVDEQRRSVLLGQQRSFAFDHAFGPHASQRQLYEHCVSELLESCFEGFNATVVAYGPTGSGKSYTLGTASALHCLEEQQGVIPRTIRYLCGG